MYIITCISLAEGSHFCIHLVLLYPSGLLVCYWWRTACMGWLETNSVRVCGRADVWGLGWQP